MAALNIFRFRRQISPVQCFISAKRLTEVGLKNNYSVYPSYYVKPVYRKEKQTELEGTEEAEKLSHTPIKAARNDNTSSVFHDETIRQFTNYIMEGGQKALARRLLEKTLENVKRAQLERYHKAPPEEKENIEIDPRAVMHSAVENCKPLLKLVPIKRGGVTYKVPVPMTEKNARWTSMKWILAAAQDKELTVHLPDKLAWELVDAHNNQGRVIKQKQDLHRQCEANRAYAHYRWG